MRILIKNIWQQLRALSGEDAYERYLEHWQREHANSNVAPMDRRSFYLAEQQRKWNRPNRCC